jgi:hypothetical protein
MAFLEQELDALLRDAGFDERQATAVALRLGLDGRGGTRLRLAAERTGYSHERVRQLEVELRAAVRRDLPVLREAVSFLERCAPDARSHVAGLLAAQGLAAAPFDPAGVVAAARLARIDADVRIRGGFLVGRQRPDPQQWLLALAREASRQGEVTVRDLSRRSSLDADRVRRLLEGCDEIHWTSDEHTALWPRIPAVERRLRRALAKVLSITGSLSLAELDAALRRMHRPVRLSQRVLLALCHSFRWLAVEGGTVRSLVQFDRYQVLTPVELELARIFRAAGPVLSFTEAVVLGGERGLNRSSVGVYVAHTPIIKRLARGRYALVGA